MKEASTLKPVIRKLIDSLQLKDGAGYPTTPAIPFTDMLFIVTRSHSPRWRSSTAYFLAQHNNIESVQALSETERVEGYLFLMEHESSHKAAELLLSDIASIVRLCDKVLELSRSDDPLVRFRAQIHFQELMYELYRISSGQVALDARTSVEQTKEYINSHYDEAMTVQSLANMASISPSYYMELFKKLVGQSPIEYLTSVRIAAARRLIENTDAPARQVAQAVGYRDPFYFSRQFKQATGMSPSRYARRDNKRIVSFHYPITGQILALQNIPYAAPLDREFCLFYKQKYELQIPVHLRDPSMEENRDFNLEALQQSKPDLIVAGDWLPESDRSGLDGIAPTLYVPWWDKDWRQHLFIVAEFLGETTQAERWLDHYEVKAAKLRGKLNAQLRESTIMAIYILNGEIHRFGSRNLGTVLYGDLQLRDPGNHIAGQVYEPLTAEQLLTLDPDHLLIASSSDPLSQQLWKDMTGRPEWQWMSAVRNGKVHRIQPDPWFEYSAMGHERILREVARLFP
ncbi:helix-turn-helix domain-containing protein [Paenibacillus radicis (ex Gao et al. 2016)]|uniref:AraC family transcriptional regulator n=1 Tax=Paenibacillus radicis (ex Gao et al. 2016) TaxID=1737354 RepID=A0A917MAV3_9BACL|nr:helix-turn-helix domain-containing protein [Paenibacillus radicis (ex Gao et al. 2016)]GGG88553.1 hypothetical protein GCM10010918_53890 [Paenibacillus radicis (ex Gao et al. 2016)]